MSEKSVNIEVKVSGAEDAAEKLRGVAEAGEALSKGVADAGKAGNTAAEGLGELGDTAADNAEKIADVGEAAGDAAEDIAGVGEAGSGAAEGLGELSDAAADSGKKIADVGEAAGDAAEDLTEVGAAGGEAAEDLDQLGDTAADSEEKIAKAGDAAADTGEKLKTVGEDAKTAGEDFGKAAEQAERAATTAAKKTGDAMDGASVKIKNVGSIGRVVSKVLRGDFSGACRDAARSVQILHASLAANIFGLVLQGAALAINAYQLFKQKALEAAEAQKKLREEAKELEKTKLDAAADEVKKIADAYKKAEESARSLRKAQDDLKDAKLRLALADLDAQEARELEGKDGDEAARIKTKYARQRANLEMAADSDKAAAAVGDAAANLTAANKALEEFQARLAAVGNLFAGVDAADGKRTFSAVEAFQKSRAQRDEAAKYGAQAAKSEEWGEIRQRQAAAFRRHADRLPATKYHNAERERWTRYANNTQQEADTLLGRAKNLRGMETISNQQAAAFEQLGKDLSALSPEQLTKLQQPPAPGEEAGLKATVEAATVKLETAIKQGQATEVKNQTKPQTWKNEDIADGNKKQAAADKKQAEEQVKLTELQAKQAADAVKTKQEQLQAARERAANPKVPDLQRGDLESPQAFAARKQQARLDAQTAADGEVAKATAEVAKAIAEQVTAQLAALDAKLAANPNATAADRDNIEYERGQINQRGAADTLGATALPPLTPNQPDPFGGSEAAKHQQAGQPTFQAAQQRVNQAIKGVTGDGKVDNGEVDQLLGLIEELVSVMEDTRNDNKDNRREIDSLRRQVSALRTN